MEIAWDLVNYPFLSLRRKRSKRSMAGPKPPLTFSNSLIESFVAFTLISFIFVMCYSDGAFGMAVQRD